MSAAPISKAVAAHAIAPRASGRPWTFYVLLAVFIPVAFFSGTTGQLYKQFAITIACAITISLFNALTLTPTLSALLLGEHTIHRKGFYGAINRVIDATRNGYHAILPALMRYRAAVLALFAISLGATYFAYQTIPTGFLPDEDLGYFFVTVQLPEGSSLADTERVTRRIEGILKDFPEVRVVFEPNGTQFGINAPNRALMFITLSPWHERTTANDSAAGVMRRLRTRVAQINNAVVLVFNPPAIRGIGNLAGFQFELQDQSFNFVNDDTGEIAERVFEQFFTNRGVGRGAGQGLAVVYSLIHDRHDGTITFTSEPGVGTTFTVRLPRRGPDQAAGQIEELAA